MAGIVWAQNAERPEVPDELKAPLGEEVMLKAHAEGLQIYVCQAGPDQKYAWVLKEPRAKLLDERGNQIGEHFAGPTWKWKDGSEVTGKAVAKHDATQPNAIPWLLVRVIGHKGKGMLDGVTTIQRLNTHGGVPSQLTLCSESKRDTEVGATYGADYYFYRPKS